MSNNVPRAIASIGIAWLVTSALAHGQQPLPVPATGLKIAAPTVVHVSANTPANVLTSDEWRRVDAAVKRALAWLATQQQPDGSFQTIENGQPGVTSLCMTAFIAHGRVPKDH